MRSSKVWPTWTSKWAAKRCKWAELNVQKADFAAKAVKAIGSPSSAPTVSTAWAERRRAMLCKELSQRTSCASQSSGLEQTTHCKSSNVEPNLCANGGRRNDRRPS